MKSEDRREYRIGDVERDVDKVVASGIQPEQFHGKHVRQPRQGMPVDLERAEGRANPAEEISLSTMGLRNT
jgi:hypothetical protein